MVGCNDHNLTTYYNVMVLRFEPITFVTTFLCIGIIMRVGGDITFFIPPPPRKSQIVSILIG